MAVLPGLSTFPDTGAPWVHGIPHDDAGAISCFSRHFDDLMIWHRACNRRETTPSKSLDPLQGQTTPQERLP